MWGFIVKLGGSNIAIVEYLGVLPGLSPHDNSKRKGDYMRTSSTAMQETSELLQKHKPLDVFNKLCNKHDELWVMDKAICSRFMTKSKMTRNETARRNDSGQTIRRKKQSGSYCFSDLRQFYY